MKSNTQQIVESGIIYDTAAHIKSANKRKGMKKRPIGCSDIKILNADGKVKKVIPIGKFLKSKNNKNQSGRKSDQYKIWEKAVVKRDRYRCVLCQSGKHINIHHIIRWVDNEEKHYDEKNGVTLCLKCHKEWHGGCGKAFPPTITDILIRYINGKYDDQG